jgi:hypothetical protein
MFPILLYEHSYQTDQLKGFPQPFISVGEVYHWKKVPSAFLTACEGSKLIAAPIAPLLVVF